MFRHDVCNLLGGASAVDGNGPEAEFSGSGDCIFGSQHHHTYTICRGLFAVVVVLNVDGFYFRVFSLSPHLLRAGLRPTVLAALS